MNAIKLLLHKLLLASFMLSTFVANAENVDLSKGTMITGGRAAFIIDPLRIDTYPSNGFFAYDLNVDFGYFVIDNLAINVNVMAGGHFTNPINDAALGGGIGAHYYFDIGSMITPYVGLVPEVIWSNTVGVQAGSLGSNTAPGFLAGATVANWNIRVPVSAGILIGLNQHIALDIGAEAGLTWGLSSAASSTPALDVIVGYVGARGFF